MSKPSTFQGEQLLIKVVLPSNAPGVYTTLLTVNADRSFKIQTSGNEVEIPDNAAPEDPVWTNYFKTTKLLSFDGTGKADIDETEDIVEMVGSDDSYPARIYLKSTGGYFSCNLKLTEWGLTGKRKDTVEGSVSGRSDGDVTYTAASSDKVFRSANQSLASAGSITLDFNGGGLTDETGATIAWTNISSVQIVADSTNTTDLTVGDAVSPFDGAINGVLEAGGSVNWSKSGGLTVTPGSNDQIKIANGSGGTAKYSIVVKGH